MFIKVEPAEFFMYRVQLIFDLAHPDSEDPAVRGYLAQHELEARYSSTGDVEGRHCEVMQFGGCYLEGHLEPIARLQRRAVEAELWPRRFEAIFMSRRARRWRSSRPSRRGKQWPRWWRSSTRTTPSSRRPMGS
jgi:hypothetical protein